ncbi:MAG: PilT/PilU family type 4a pilus ATPase [Pseudomonadaceae bacterium]|jgi:twitching motility protein PilU|uniref:Twitching motility protein PilU n=1 Tax=Halopseudomonas formosensis TaxID=1002526 RepID=A0A1I6BWJ1_9GAMM|nr:PilT/PilU family type 4a pilus ATPase [Halopseudomonas formosensis]MDY3196993.1 PilT/PilU family type 4a pilus ATPase [Pseudomonadaceae bacterium]NLC01242.1 PilT/PilU family type 4a pilus ATPase [Halopseudomonas formosensis]SFQ85292.1 twitching motility protein PilU [Halopseudomonas formosensis]
MDVFRYLHALSERNGSDLFFSVGAPVTLKREGHYHPLEEKPLGPGEVKQLAYQLMSQKQIAEFERTLEMNLAVGVPNAGRFRVNVYYQRGEVAMVVRHINNKIPRIAELGLPPVLEKLVMLDRGLILVVGAAGSGKSTTLASMLDYRTANRAGHIVCIEDPIEFLHRHQKAIIDQREVGLDTMSFAEALRNVLRESPDVIMIGEIRDLETMQHALHYSDTGHLVLATLHATNASQAVERMVNMFPKEARNQVLGDIAMNLAAVIGQRLVPGVEKKRVAAVELLLRTPYIVDLIARDELEEIKSAMSRSAELGLQTFDQHLYELVQSGAISLDEALKHADSRTDLTLRARLEKGFSYEENEMKVLRDSDLTDDFR